MAQTNGISKRKTAVESLRQMIADPERLIVCPGVYDGFTARIALQEGADVLYMVCYLPPPNRSIPFHIRILLYSFSSSSSLNSNSY
jgi:hypothetical protein